MLLAATWLTASVSAQGSPEELAAAVAPFLDDQAVAVAILSLADATAPAAIGDLLQAAAVSDEERQEAVEIIEGAHDWLERMRAAGARHLCVVFSLADFPDGGPFLVALFGEQGRPGPIGELLGASGATSGRGLSPFPVFEYIGARGVVAGSKLTVDRLRAHIRGGQAARQPEHLGEALAELADSPVKIVLVPSDEHRRVIREMLPVLEWPLEGVSGEMIASGLVWAAIGVDPAEHVARAVVQSENGVAAARLAQGIERGLDVAFQLDEVRQLVGDPRRIVLTLRPTLVEDRLVWNLDAADGNYMTIVEEVLAPPVRAARAAAQQSHRTYQFRRIAIAMHNYHDVYKSFPPQSIRDADGRPLLSWRVAILPYLEQQALYEEFHLDEPWDSPHNIRLVERMPAIYADPALAELAAAGNTTYQVPLHEATVFPPAREGVKINEIEDGTSKTVMAVEVESPRAVPWTKPADWQVDQDDPLAGVKQLDRETFLAAYCDGSVRTISIAIDPKAWWHALTRAAHDP
jgi:hypothetical protein